MGRDERRPKLITADGNVATPEPEQPVEPTPVPDPFLYHVTWFNPGLNLGEGLIETTTVKAHVVEIYPTSMLVFKSFYRDDTGELQGYHVRTFCDHISMRQDPVPVKS
jgi:hypothetical protein